MQRNRSSLLQFSNLIVVLVVVGLLQPASAQNADPTQHAPNQGTKTKDSSEVFPNAVAAPSQAGTSAQTTSSEPVLGPGDEVEITVYGAPDLSGRTRVGANGSVSMPLVGYIHVAGLSNSEAEEVIATQLRQNNVVNTPQVSVYVREYTTSGISVAGEVLKPGVYSALGPHRLSDILQKAGGLTERAANSVTISHRGGVDPITVELPKDPGALSRVNVELFPGDTVVVARAGIVYVLGEVTKPGGYVLNGNGGVTVMQAVAAAGGPSRLASVGGTKMLRRTPTGLQEVPVRLKDIMHAKAPDVPVQAEDIIFVPNSRIKTVLNSGQLLTSLGTAAIYQGAF